jgi:hypothetical protein
MISSVLKIINARKKHDAMKDSIVLMEKMNIGVHLVLSRININIV